MASVFIRHRVRDYDVWKAVFDEGVDARREQGVIAHSVHCDATDPNLVIIALRVQDLAGMQKRAGLERRYAPVPVGDLLVRVRRPQDEAFFPVAAG